VLVAYGSQFGSTAAIAERIARVMRGEGHDCTVATADQAPDPSSFDAAVIGSAVHAGHRLRGATAFVERIESSLGSRPVWLFNSGPLSDRGVAGPQPDPKEVGRFRRSIDPRDHRVFAGLFDRATADFSGLGLAERTVVKHFLPDGDWRDWEAIEGWARGIARTLHRSGRGTRMPTG
jgi:menaquinone-dependent protoporphyrinogen oxidase